MTFTSGFRLGPYELAAPIGAGGMGEVWRAKDSRLGRDVAVKILPPSFAENPDMKARFEREARTISSLNHPNICTLFDVGQHDGTNFLVMELLEGESLADRIEKGPLPVEQVLRYGAQIADALDRAHRQGIVHRDLKPANVMLTKSGAKLLDFGLARLSTQGGAVHGLTNLPTEARPLTQEGTILGTFQYMAPEQLEGEEADPRTDIFAFGAVLYEMATGRRAFEGSSRTSLIAAIVSSQPAPISTIAPMAPPALDRIVRKCMEKDPEERWQSAHDVASELRWISEAGSQEGVTVSGTSRRRNSERLAWTLAAILALSLIAAVAMLVAPRGGDASVPYELSMTAPAGATLRTGSNIGGPVISPDGRRVAFFADSDEGSGLWVRSIGRSDARLIGGTSVAMYPFWSPDSRSLAYFDGAGSGSLKRVDVSGGLPVVVADIGSFGRGGSWSEDGRILFATANGTIWGVRAEGGAPSGVTTLDTERNESAHYWPQFVGDQHFLYFIRNSRKELEGIYLGSIGQDGKESSRRFVVASSSSGRFVPDEPGARTGHLLWVQNGRLLARPLDLGTGELSGEVRELGVTVDVLESQRGALFSVADNGALVASSPSQGRVQVVSLGRDGTGLQMHHEVEDGAMTHRLHISPDGRWIAFGVNKEGNADLWIHDLETSVTSPLTFGPSHDEFAVWSPDSSAVVFRSSAPPKQYLGRANLSTREVAHTDLGSIDFAFIPYAFLDDGRVVGSKFGPVRGIAASTAEGSAELVTLVDGEIVESVSPDRNWILTRSSTSDGLLVPRRVNVTAGKLALGPPGARFPLDRPDEAIWTSGGDEVIARRNRKIFSVPVNRANDSISFGPPVELHRAPPMRTGIAPSQDGSRIFFVINPADASHTFTVVGDWRSRL